MEDDGKPNGELYDALIARVQKAIEDTIDTVTFIWIQGDPVAK